MRDFLLAFRRFRQNPGFASAAVISLALGIGANTGIFTLLDALVLRPLPVYQPARLVRIGGLDPRSGAIGAVPGPVFEALRGNPMLDGVCAVLTPLSTIEVHGNLAPVAGHALSGDCYGTLGIRPALGRLIAPSDDVPNGPRVTVLSYRFWQSEFQGRSNVLGQSIRIEGVPFSIIGVTPPSFHGLLLGFAPRVSFPITQEINPDSFGEVSPAHIFYWAQVFARLKPGVTARQLQARLQVEWPGMLERGLPAGVAGADRKEQLRQPVAVVDGSTGLDYSLRRRFRRPLFALMCIAGLVLLISCINIANLLLARGLETRRDIAVRIALGAPRWRLARQMAVESLLLMLAGGTLGVLLAYQGDRILLALFGASYSAFDLAIAPDSRVLLFTSAIALTALFLFGIMPAWQNSDMDSAGALKDAGRATSATRSSARRGLVVAQVSLTLVLVCGASLFFETLRRLQNAPLGVATSGLLGVQMMALPGGHGKNFEGRPYARDLLRRLENLPGVESAALTSFLPFFNRVSRDNVKSTEGQSAPVETGYGFVGDHFFSAMRIPILRGDDFHPESRDTGRKTAILSESLALALFPAGDAVGRRVDIGTGKDFEIVGIVADTRWAGPRAHDQFFVYQNIWQFPRNLRWAALLIRAHGDPSLLSGPIRGVIRAGGHDYVDRISTVQADRDLFFFQERLVAWLAAAFGVLALTLASVGLYGLLSYHVTSRTAEIGIRMALGARRRDIRWLVVRESLWLFTAGLFAGFPIVYASMRALSSLFYGFAGIPLLPLGFATLVLTLVAAAASWIPVRRATAIDPLSALRAE